MPRKPLRPCRYPGCARLSDEVYCPEHRLQFTRESATVRGYDSRWRAARKRYLRNVPLCVQCQQQGKLKPATVVDHIIPHRGNETLFWEESNWQALCKPCHDKKTGNQL